MTSLDDDGIARAAIVCAETRCAAAQAAVHLTALCERLAREGTTLAQARRDPATSVWMALSHCWGFAISLLHR